MSHVRTEKRVTMNEGMFYQCFLTTVDSNVDYKKKVVRERLASGVAL